MPIKSRTTMVGGGKKIIKKEKKSPKKLQNKSKHKNNKCESPLSESFPSLGVTVHLTSLGFLPTL